METGELVYHRPIMSKKKGLYYNPVCLPLDLMLFQNETSMRHFQSKMQDTSVRCYFEKS